MATSKKPAEASTPRRRRKANKPVPVPVPVPPPTAAAAPDARDQVIHDLMTKLANQELATAQLVQQLAQAQPATPTRAATRLGTGQYYVGVRNVSGYTISIPNKITGEPELNLHAPRADRADPKTVAIVSYAWWQHLRRDKHYDRGMIVRDDTILGGLYEAAPPDRPQDCAPNHAKNLVLDAAAWVAARDDEAIRDGVDAMTSEASLKKLEALVFLERERLMLAFQELEWRERKKRVERELPSKYRHLEACIRDRLEQLVPKHD